MRMYHDKLTLEDKFTLDKIIGYVDGTIEGEDWSELLPSYQLVIVKWLIVELYEAQKRLENYESF